MVGEESRDKTVPELTGAATDDDDHSHDYDVRIVFMSFDVLCPVLFSKVTPALCRPHVRGFPSIWSVFLYVVQSNFPRIEGG